MSNEYKITNKEKELIEFVRELKFGEFTLIVHNGEPKRAKDIKKDKIFKDEK